MNPLFPPNPPVAVAPKPPVDAPKVVFAGLKLFGEFPNPGAVVAVVMFG
jgi:hypothetical protein